MRIIPVLDILNEQVVHGIKGERNKYKPIHSILTSSCDPLEVTNAFKNHFPIREIYIADLDAILYKKFSQSYLEKIISETNVEIMLDAGIDELTPILKLLKIGVKKVIIGTETLRSLSNLEYIFSTVSPKYLILSLDLIKGHILTKDKTLSIQAPIQALRQFERFGVQELIILELSKIGSESGVMTTTLKELLEKATIPIITGGGARNFEDLRILKDAGISGVLIATALHKGTITSRDLDML